MMSRFFSVIALLCTVLLAVVHVQAAPTPIEARQLGNLQCNLDRLKIVVQLAKAAKTVKGLTTDLAADDTQAAGVQAVADGISGAQSAIGTIGKALITGQKAPAEARDQVQSNLEAAIAAAGALTSTDEKITASIEDAKTQLANAAIAGEGVVANCK